MNQENQVATSPSYDDSTWNSSPDNLLEDLENLRYQIRKIIKEGGNWDDIPETDLFTVRALSGYSGYSGYSGLSGYSGYSGLSGYSGIGLSGYSGYSGLSGYSGYSGLSGYSGIGLSGYSGYSGLRVTLDILG